MTKRGHQLLRKKENAPLPQRKSWLHLCCAVCGSTVCHLLCVTVSSRWRCSDCPVPLRCFCTCSSGTICRCPDLLTYLAIIDVVVEIYPVNSLSLRSQIFYSHVWYCFVCYRARAEDEYSKSLNKCCKLLPDIADTRLVSSILSCHCTCVAVSYQNSCACCVFHQQMPTKDLHTGWTE